MDETEGGGWEESLTRFMPNYSPTIHSISSVLNLLFYPCDPLSPAFPLFHLLLPPAWRRRAHALYDAYHLIIHFSFYCGRCFLEKPQRIGVTTLSLFSAWVIFSTSGCLYSTTRKGCTKSCTIVPIIWHWDNNTLHLSSKLNTRFMRHLTYTFIFGSRS